jgi:hypothetical protein
MNVIAIDISALRQSESPSVWVFVSVWGRFNPFIDLDIWFVSSGHFPANCDVFDPWSTARLPYP